MCICEWASGGNSTFFLDGLQGGGTDTPETLIRRMMENRIAPKESYAPNEDDVI